MRPRTVKARLPSLECTLQALTWSGWVDQVVRERNALTLREHEHRMLIVTVTGLVIVHARNFISLAVPNPPAECALHAAITATPRRSHVYTGMPILDGVVTRLKI